jgi:hypothetical protein
MTIREQGVSFLGLCCMSRQGHIVYTEFSKYLFFVIPEIFNGTTIFFFSMTRNPSKVGHFVYPLLLSKPWTRVKHPLHTDKIFNGPTKMMDVSLSSLLYQTKKINQKSTMHLKKPRIIVLQHFKTQGKFSPTRRERCSER